jgi:acyl-CoA thioesterase I
MRKTSLVWAAALLLALCSHGVTAAPPRACEAPDDATSHSEYLQHVASVLKPGATLEVLAVGSATLFGPEASFLQPHGTAAGNSQSGQIITTEPSDRAFPYQMAKALEHAMPGLKVHLSVRGGRGLMAGEMLALIRNALAERSYQLVLWQTGTVEAVRNRQPGEFGQVLAEGADAVGAANADLVLIDPQFSRFLQTNSNIEPYEQAFAQAATIPGVLLFRRYDLMRNWATEGIIDLERTPKAERGRVADELHACLGAQLARIVLASTRS